MEVNNIKIDNWIKDGDRPLVIAGPCSAESEEQLMETCRGVKEQGINVMRAGVWKPRTRPGTFEGIGEEALTWIENVKAELGVKFAIEVAMPQHVELALKHNIDILWIGARSTVNPFTVQEIADSLKGVDVPVMIKNPINPDLALWIGAIERIANAGITKLGAIHRGFSSHQKTKYRNIPMWQYPIDLKSKFPNMPIIGDPSHIGGSRDMIFDISQKSLDLNYDGLMIETHRDPDNALSDAKQQVTPERLGEILTNLKIRTSTSDDALFINHLEELRDKIDNIDREIVESIAARMRVVEKIGEYKKENNVTIFQLKRWNNVASTRADWAKSFDLSEDFLEDLYKSIHSESIKIQTEIMNKLTENGK